ncbi:hypothetical protein DICPUDRAFT_99686 [Dictyostelium purpureum]|uniref:Uncharacterized protein n=1 Tax=Dictyostelium purpureum TaxID=5786 RepID=F1A1J3_DICPU|nr:uncharacterized protein DICPUDRAFT_99686 [Dictyostelium purpureum]EGC29939.1 hypothetical protein DICPUDRAFT_99686 [Dictyostelium purpureum]|eukprot:XP_003293542.1 hypothetical protein DICPUDRAFT_99686 [Dictyostelium purpureum]
MSYDCLLEIIKKETLPSINEFLCFDTFINLPPKQKGIRKLTDPSEYCYSRKRLAVSASSNSNCGDPSNLLEDSRSFNTHRTDYIEVNTYSNYNNGYPVQPNFHDTSTQESQPNESQTVQTQSNFDDMSTHQTQSNVSQTVQTQSNLYDTSTHQTQSNVSQTVQTQSNFHDMNTLQARSNKSQTVQTHSIFQDLTTQQTQSDVSQTVQPLPTPEELLECLIAIRMQQQQQQQQQQQKYSQYLP